MINFATFIPQHILVLQQRQIGDVLLTTPAISALRRRYPNAEIDVLTEKKCVDMLIGNPCINSIISMDKDKLHGISAIKWYWNVAHGKYDMVVDFQSLPRLKIISLFSGAKVRFAATIKKRSPIIYNAHPPKIVHGYAAWEKVDLLSPLGVQNIYEPPILCLSDKEISDAKSYLESIGLKSGERFITIDVTHRRPTCKWPPEHYIKAIDMLHERYADLKFFLFHGPGEEEKAQMFEVLQGLTTSARKMILNFDSVQTLRMIAGCISHASLHFGNCSAPQHMAVSLGVPTCIILGGTGPAWHCPVGNNVDLSANVDCQYCQKNTCDRDFICLKKLTPDIATMQVEKILSLGSS